MLAFQIIAGAFMLLAGASGMLVTGRAPQARGGF
jgi:hypothetical protein